MPAIGIPMGWERAVSSALISNTQSEERDAPGAQAISAATKVFMAQAINSMYQRKSVECSKKMGKKPKSRAADSTTDLDFERPHASTMATE